MLPGGGTYQTHLDELIKTQKRIIRTINHSTRLEHTNLLFKENNLLKLTDINKIETLKIIHKHENDKLPQTFQNCITKNKDKHDYDTRQRNDYTVPKYKREIARRSSVFSRGVGYWNKLPDQLKSVNSENNFKNKLKTQIISRY